MPDRAALAATFAAVSGPDRVAARREVQSVEDEVVALLGLRGRGQVRRPTRQVTATAAPIGAARVAVVLQRTVRAGRVGMTSAESASAVRDAVTPGRAAVLAVWCSFIPVRDVAWSSMTPADAVSHLALWTAVSQRVVPPYEPAVLALAAFAAWLSGDGASAWCALDRCVEVSPQLLDGGLGARDAGSLSASRRVGAVAPRGCLGCLRSSPPLLGAIVLSGGARPR